MDVSEAFNVTAVPFLVLTRAGTVLEEVSGSDATKVREAIEKHVKSGAPANGVSAPASAEKRDLSQYAPTKSDPATAPEYSSGTGEQNKEDLHARLTNLVKAAPVMLFMKGE